MTRLRIVEALRRVPDPELGIDKYATVGTGGAPMDGAQVARLGDIATGPNPGVTQSGRCSTRSATARRSVYHDLHPIEQMRYHLVLLAYDMTT
jgi:hypothetical protein